MNSHNVILDVLKNAMIIDGEFNPLSKNECLLIKYLYERQGASISRDELTQHCWPGKIVSAASLPVAIKHIRDVLKKIKSEEIVKTHKGEGYSFIPGIIEIKIIDRHPGDGTMSTKETVKIKSRKSQARDFLTALTIGVSVFFWGGSGFVIYTRYANNIKHWHTKNGLLIISTTETMDEFTGAVHEGDTIFIDDMDSMLICNKLKCNFIK
ncbi:winged helix-turn-helix domain-containing protein [Escherichia coli]|uniref:winged helix-turn-helix domain-containing protein n=1 Tax=Escherichia coli TaxID=562 RepID=UPI000BE62963|nr:winged helix-turn-helix domain-containing protein [Escherichia coli]MBB9375321.1 winged helix-turn-helix domain-containing protein [Escherichia coli]